MPTVNHRPKIIAPTSQNCYLSPPMPELPEVETVARGLRQTVLGRRFHSIRDCSAHISRMNRRSFPKSLENRLIVEINRIGKNLFLELDDKSLLWIHLRMTGQLIFGNPPPIHDRHCHFIVTFQDMPEVLVYRDLRKFGQLVHVGAAGREKFMKKLNLGPDALQIAEKEFIELLKHRARMLKPLLLDQSQIAGLGNIYVDETLLRSRIHPRRISSGLSLPKMREMYKHMRRILKMAIAKMGTTVDTFSRVNNAPGNYQSYLRAYDRQGQLCRLCKKRRIKRIVVAQRGTHICPYCQRI